MAVIKKDGNFMGLPMNIARGNPIPLDKSEIWYSYEAMAAYAQTDPVAYVGQILGLVDEANGSAKAYIILNTAGDLQEVGAAILVDEATIVLKDDDTLSLKDFGKRYYRYVEATGSEDEGNFVAAHYEPQDVDADHPWKAGLEPKVARENNTLVLGWYEPNPTTIEGVNAQVAGIQSAVNDLTSTVEDVVNDLADVYTKDETEEKIAEAIANVEHLKREIVDELPPVAEAEANVIYMVPSGLTADDNKYYEYILLNGRFEKVGSWEVDLSQYAKTEDVVAKEEGKSLVDDDEIEKLKTVEEGAEKNIVDSVGDEFALIDRKLSLVSLPTTIDLSTNESLKDELNKLVLKEDGKALVSLSEIEKLATVARDAEKNVINEVSEEFEVDENRKLKIKSVDGSKISNIDANEAFKELALAVQSAQDDIAGHTSDINKLESDFATLNTTLTAKLNDYVLKTTYNSDIAEIRDHLTWHDLPQQQ
jgi:hypothetical protein